MYCNRRRYNDVSRNNCDPGFESAGESLDRREFNCRGDRKVIKHEYIVKHQHDIVDEYDIIHEHEYNRYNVFSNREVVRENDYTTPLPDVCGDNQCGAQAR
jgi:hypothetical protein